MASSAEEHQLVPGVLMILMSSIGITGNILTIILVKNNQTFRYVNQARLFLGNLATVDFLNSIIGLLSGLGYINRSILMSDHKELCYLTAYALMVFPYLAILSMTLLTFNRYFTTVHYSKAERLFHGRKTWLFILAIWALLLLIACIHVLMNSGTEPEFRLEQGLCTTAANINSKSRWFFTLVGSLSSICLILMLYFNVKMCIIIHKHNRRIRNQNAMRESVVVDRNRKMTQITIVIFVCYMICYTPVTIYSAFSHTDSQRKISFPIVFLLQYINYVNNVFIYGAMDKNYRRNVRRLFCR